jgi:hypothetical protein
MWGWVASDDRHSVKKMAVFPGRIRIVRILRTRQNGAQIRERTALLHTIMRSPE